MTDVLVVKWGNGNVDVFASPDEIDKDYADNPELAEEAHAISEWQDADEVASWNYGVWTEGAKRRVS